MEKENKPTLTIIVCCPRFKASIKRLKKRFRSIQSDITQALAEVEATGNLGDPLPGHSGTVFKKRLASSDIPHGKQDCYRLYLYRPEDSMEVWPLYVLFKGDAPDIAGKEIQEIIESLPEKDDC